VEQGVGSGTLDVLATVALIVMASLFTTLLMAAFHTGKAILPLYLR